MTSCTSLLRALVTALLLPSPLLAQTTSGSAPTGGSIAGTLMGLRHAELAGNPLDSYPWFERVRAFNAGAPVSLAIDPTHLPDLIGLEVDVYIVAHKDPGLWFHDQTLIDVRGQPLVATFTGSSTRENLITIDTGTLLGTTGTTVVDVGYDVVIDADRNGLLSVSDVIDGVTGEAGFYVVTDLTVPGPYSVVEAIYSGGTFLGQDLYYPANVSELGALPLVVVSHGNGHNYTWYDHIGEHLASWGYVVMAHQNNTGPGIETASTTTLTNTEYLLANLATIEGGLLAGHVDATRIVWIGHSRGGEGVVRAYDRIYDGAYMPQNFTLESLQLISSIAPTDFLGTDKANPHGVPYSLWTGGADSDVNGCANCDICQTFHLHERAGGERFSISLHGVGHGDFHDGGGSSVASGPCRVGRTDTHAIMRGYLLPLVKHAVEGDLACKEYLWRQWERFRPIGAPDANTCVVVDLMYQQGPAAQGFVIDDFQTNPDLQLSSSGGRVVSDVELVTEGRLDDNDNGFTKNDSDPMNGMTFCGPNDASSGVVFQLDGTSDRYALFEIEPPARDVRSFDYLSFRAAQTARHDLTINELADVSFTVSLVDGEGRSSAIDVGGFGGGIEEPYQRTGCGSGTGWANEFETIRLRLADFSTDRADFDATNVIAVLFLFGPSYGSDFARLGLDEIEFVAQ